MDSGKKQVGFSAGAGAPAPAPNNSTISSFTNDLFGSTDNYNNSYSSSSSSFAEAFGSVFDPPPSKVFGGKTMRSEQASVTRDQYSSSHLASSGRRKGQDSNSGGLRSLDSIFQPHHQQQQQPPCHLSSSIYYGGQDVYPNPNTDGSFSNSSSSSAAKSEGEELDERDYASRGNWWQGSLYY